MYVMNVTDYVNVTDDYKCTINENFIDIIIPTLLLTVSCGLSFLWLMNLMVYTLMKPLFNNKW